MDKAPDKKDVASVLKKLSGLAEKGELDERALAKVAGGLSKAEFDALQDLAQRMAQAAEIAGSMTKKDGSGGGTIRNL